MKKKKVINYFNKYFFLLNSWKFGGKNVFLTGTFDDWQGKLKYF